MFRFIFLIDILPENKLVNNAHQTTVRNLDKKEKSCSIFSLIPVFSWPYSAFFNNFILPIILIPALVFSYITFVLLLTLYRFSSWGDNYQDKIHHLLVKKTEVSGSTLDIGCGNGSLSIKVAKKFPHDKITGIDYWGESWEYALEQCVTNARLENVLNVSFSKGTAAKIDFDDDNFGNVISCLCFHEVRDVKEKKDCIFEALRVLRPGGTFVFLDLFDDKSFYPDFDRTILIIESSIGIITENLKLKDLIKLPYPLNHKKSLHFARLLVGKKRDK